MFLRQNTRSTTSTPKLTMSCCLVLQKPQYQSHDAALRGRRRLRMGRMLMFAFTFLQGICLWNGAIHAHRDIWEAANMRTTDLGSVNVFSPWLDLSVMVNKVIWLHESTSVIWIWLSAEQMQFESVTKILVTQNHDKYSTENITISASWKANVAKLLQKNAHKCIGVVKNAFLIWEGVYFDFKISLFYQISF